MSSVAEVEPSMVEAANSLMSLHRASMSARTASNAFSFNCVGSSSRGTKASTRSSIHKGMLSKLLSSINKNPQKSSCRRTARSAGSFLLDACGQCRVEEVREYIYEGLDVNSQDDFGFTGLFVAGMRGHLQVLVVLLAAGASPNISCAWGETPLFAAAVAGHRSCAEILIKYGADLCHRNHKGKTVMDVIVDQLQTQKQSSAQRNKMASCLELILTMYAHALRQADASAAVVDFRSAAAVVVNQRCEHMAMTLHVPFA